MASVVLTGCHHGGGGAPGRASMLVSPQSALYDAAVTVSANATDYAGTGWNGSAQFRATSAGAVTLDQTSLGGSYAGPKLLAYLTAQ